MPYVLVAYDISDDPRRERARRRLQARGYRMLQRSVYIARGGSTEAKEAAAMLRGLLGPGDRLLVLVVPMEAVRRRIAVGDDALAEKGERSVVAV